MLLRKLTHDHHRSGTFAFQAYFSSYLFFTLKGEALWCPSNVITAAAQNRQRQISFGFAVAQRKWERLNPHGVKSKRIWPVTRGVLFFNARHQLPHSIMKTHLAQQQPATLNTAGDAVVKIGYYVCAMCVQALINTSSKNIFHSSVWLSYRLHA